MRIPLALWDAVAGLLDYPDSLSYFSRLNHCIEQLQAASCQASAPLARMREDVASCGLGALQELYIAAFDFDPTCTLEIGWHLFSDTPDRGPWLAGLREDLARTGVVETGELPDHLRHLLMLVAREETTRAGDLAALVTPVVQDVRRRLGERANPFAGVLEAACLLLETRFDHEGVGHD